MTHTLLVSARTASVNGNEPSHPTMSDVVTVVTSACVSRSRETVHFAWLSPPLRKTGY